MLRKVHLKLIFSERVITLQKALDFLVGACFYFTLTVSSSYFHPILSYTLSFLILFLDLCRNFHCKRGKVCQEDKQGKPSCICQDPAACPSTKDYERVSITFSAQHVGKPATTCARFHTPLLLFRIILL